MLWRGAPMGERIPKAFFGMHYLSLTGWSGGAITPFHDVGAGMVRMWDTGTTWKRLETAKGVYDPAVLSRINGIVSACVANGCKILFTLGQAPTWANGDATVGSYSPVPPTNDQDWVDYVTYMVGLLPAGSAYQVWNEPDYSLFYTGTQARLVELHALAYDTIKALDPTATIVSAGATVSDRGWRYYSGYIDGVLSKTDAVGFHSYVNPRDPEAVRSVLLSLRGELDKLGAASLPIWNTEFTWHDYTLQGQLVDGDIGPVMSDEMASSYIVRAMMMGWLGGARRQFFYGMDASWSSLRMIDLVDRSTRLPASYAYEYLAGLLTNGRLYGYRCGTPHVVKFLTASGRYGECMWCADDVTTTVDTTGYSEVRDVLGQPVTKSAAYTLTSSPIYCFN